MTHKRVGTLDYLRKAHEARSFWFNTVQFHEADIAKLTDEELAAEIARCEVRLKLAATSYLRKSFTSRINWLSQIQQHRIAEGST